MSFIYKKKVPGPNTEPCGAPDITFDIEELQFLFEILFPITQIRLKLALYDTSDAIMKELTHLYVMINCVECFKNILIYSNGSLFAVE